MKCSILSLIKRTLFAGRLKMSTSTKTRMAIAVANSSSEVFLRSFFDRFGSPSRVTRAIQDLIKEGKLTRLGYGVYAKTASSPITGNPIPRQPLETLVAQAFKALKVDAQLGKARADYASGQTTQIPMGLVVSVKGSRVQRKLRLGTREVIYEKNLTATA
jgi:hypothetical protein